MMVACGFRPLRWALTTVALGACASPEVDESFDVVFSGVSDDGTPVEGVIVSAGGRQLGATTAEGTLRARIVGREGDAPTIEHECPSNLAAEAPDRLRLRRVEGLERAPEPLRLALPCRRAIVSLVVVVDSGVEGLLVRVDERFVATTDRDGVAHAYLELSPGAETIVELDTRQRPHVRPRNPRRSFHGGASSPFVVFSQSFVEERPRARRTARRKMHVPYRLE